MQTLYGSIEDEVARLIGRPLPEWMRIYGYEIFRDTKIDSENNYYKMRNNSVSSVYHNKIDVRVITRLMQLGAVPTHIDVEKGWTTLHFYIPLKKK